MNELTIAQTDVELPDYILQRFLDHILSQTRPCLFQQAAARLHLLQQ